MNTLDIDVAPLTARGLHLRYGSRTVLDGVDLALEPGSVLGLIGRNGAGKTSLIRCLLGLQQADAGLAELFGEPALQPGDQVKARLGYVPQQPDGLDWLSVDQLLDFVSRFYPRWDHALVDTLLGRWELPGTQLIGRLSPGERQRLALIRALAPRPDLLVLDEPASALDPVARRELLREIAGQAADSGTTVLFSTHILSDLERVASHVAFLDRGGLLLNGELDALKASHVRLLLPAALAARVDGPLPGELRRRVGGDGSLRLLLGAADAHGLPAVAAEAGARVDRLSLEDLFLEVVE